MTAKLAFVLVYIFAVFSTEEKKDKESLLQLNQELKQSVHDLQLMMEAVQIREKNVKSEHEKLQLMFVKFYLGKKNDEKELSQLKQKLEQGARDLEKLNDTLQKRHHTVTANLNAREKELDAREESFQKREENLCAREQQLTIREKGIDLNDRREKLEDLQKREQTVNVREKIKLHAQEKSLQNRDENLGEMASSLCVCGQQLTMRDKGINSNDAVHGRKNSNGPEASPENSICHFNLYPNESSIKVFHDMETNEMFWVDPKNLVRTEIKEAIEASLRQKGQKMSNRLMDIISNWSNFPSEANPFVKELMMPLAEHVDVEKRAGAYNFTALMFAARFDAEEAVVKLIERGANTEAVHEYGWTVRYEWVALHWAAIYGCYSASRALLEKGAKINAQNKNGKTALMFAAEFGNDEVVKLLLEFGADVRIKSKNGMIALYYAINNCGEVIRTFEREKQI